VKAKTAATNALQALLITAPEPLRAQLRCRSTIKLVETCGGLRPDMARLHEATQALKLALRSVAQRADALAIEARQLNRQLAALTERAAPAMSGVFALGPDTTSALLVSIGDNPDRLRSESAFAHLCGVAPIPASSGKTNRHRLHRGGDRSANHARTSPSSCGCATASAPRPTPPGARQMGSPWPIIRCLKRYLAREVFIALRADYATITT
jgi:hypothetical protein